jgi:hypothetical protein
MSIPFTTKKTWKIHGFKKKILDFFIIKKTTYVLKSDLRGKTSKKRHPVLDYFL